MSEDKERKKERKVEEVVETSVGTRRLRQSPIVRTGEEKKEFIQREWIRTTHPSPIRPTLLIII